MYIDKRPGLIALSLLLATSCATFDETVVLDLIAESPGIEDQSKELYVREFCTGTERWYGSGIPSLKTLLAMVRQDLQPMGANSLAKAEVLLYARQYKCGSLDGQLNLRLCWRLSGYPVYVSPPEE